jgi:hypothetical protein
MIFNTFNLVLFFAVVNAAKAKAAGQAAWVRAIERAAEQIHDNPYIAEDGDALLIQSATGNEIYRANGTCQCKAYNRNMPCWHRAAAQLVKRYREAEEKEAAKAASAAALPMVPVQSKAPDRHERPKRRYCVSDRAY